MRTVSICSCSGIDKCPWARDARLLCALKMIPLKRKNKMGCRVCLAKGFQAHNAGCMYTDCCFASVYNETISKNVHAKTREALLTAGRVNLTGDIVRNHFPHNFQTPWPGREMSRCSELQLTATV